MLNSGFSSYAATNASGPPSVPGVNNAPALGPAGSRGGGPAITNGGGAEILPPAGVVAGTVSPACSGPSANLQVTSRLQTFARGAVITLPALISRPFVPAFQEFIGLMASPPPEQTLCASIGSLQTLEWRANLNAAQPPAMLLPYFPGQPAPTAVGRISGPPVPDFRIISPLPVAQTPPMSIGDVHAWQSQRARSRRQWYCRTIRVSRRRRP